MTNDEGKSLETAQVISNEFGKFFTDIGPKIANSIPLSQNSYEYYLKRQRKPFQSEDVI